MLHASRVREAVHGSTVGISETPKQAVLDWKRETKNAGNTKHSVSPIPGLLDAFPFLPSFLVNKVVLK